jgi:hypothetical protein
MFPGVSLNMYCNEICFKEKLWRSVTNQLHFIVQKIICLRLHLH